MYPRHLLPVEVPHQLTEVVVVAEVHELLLQYLWVEDTPLVPQVRLT
jgi:hypothetical protein